MQVMLVENHPSLARLYQEELEEAGFSVRVRPDLCSAMNTLKRYPAQLVITDASSVGSSLERWLPDLRMVHGGPVVALVPELGVKGARTGVMKVLKTSDLKPLIRYLRGQKASLMWTKAATA
jgi:DNA-binding response OmpR family regulator